MKIAAVTNDGRSISAHFGKARKYLIVTVEDGKVVNEELRDKSLCEHGGRDRSQDGALLLHAQQPAQPINTHGSAADLITDCAVVLSRGMGQGMFYHLQQAGVRPVLTKTVSIDAAVEALLAGTLEEHPDLVHGNHDHDHDHHHHDHDHDHHDHH